MNLVPGTAELYCYGKVIDKFWPIRMKHSRVLWYKYVVTSSLQRHHWLIKELRIILINKYISQTRQCCIEDKAEWQWEMERALAYRKGERVRERWYVPPYCGRRFPEIARPISNPNRRRSLILTRRSGEDSCITAVRIWREINSSSLIFHSVPDKHSYLLRPSVYIFLLLRL